MNNSFSQNIALPAIVAIFTVFITGSIFIFWIRENPETFSNTFNSFILTEENNLDINKANIYSSEDVVVNTVKKVNPAVVSITISKSIPVYERYFESNPLPLGEYFGEDIITNVPRYRQKGVEERDIGGGSGFLVSKDGYIVTNSHVVDDKNAEYTVTLNDGRKLKAKVVKNDPYLDLAVIKISGSNFPYLNFGDSSKIEIGQSVIAIGNALAEFRNSVSLGIVSGLGRTIVAGDFEGNSEALEDLIQTDAAINEGNSGGPLLSLNGEVIGVNVAIAKGAENIGFAINGNRVKKIVEEVKNK
jgi:serine protease Do